MDSTGSAPGLALELRSGQKSKKSTTPMRCLMGQCITYSGFLEHFHPILPAAISLER